MLARARSLAPGRVRLGPAVSLRLEARRRTEWPAAAARRGRPRRTERRALSESYRDGEARGRRRHRGAPGRRPGRCRGPQGPDSTSLFEAAATTVRAAAAMRRSI